MEDFSIKKFLPRSLLWRSMLILVLPVFLIQVFTAFIFFDRHWSKITNLLASSVAGEIVMIANDIDSAQSTEQITNISESAKQTLDFLVGFEEGGKIEKKDISHQAWGIPVSQSLTAALQSLTNREYLIETIIPKKRIELRMQLSKGVLYVDLPRRRLFSSSSYIFLLWGVGSSLLLLGIAILFMRNQIKPIRRLAIAAERFGTGRDVPFFKPEGAKEVRQAARSFMGMKDRINRQIQQRTAMLAGVSHDLRTPLTRIKLQVEMLADEEETQYLKQDIQEMERMIDGYLQFVRGEGDEQPQRVSIEGIFKQVVLVNRHDETKIHLEIKEDISALIRPIAFERCLKNLILNAQKYANQIWITINKLDKKMIIMIEDDGPGLEGNQYEEVFKPFYRGDSSRNSKTGGIGLGLTIVQEIIHAHGGEITLSKSKYGGLAAKIMLPL